MKTFREAMDEQKQAARAEQLAQQNEAVLRQFFTVHREFKDCMAARKLIDNFFEGAPLSAQLLEDAILATSLYQMLPKQTVEDDREKLQQDITALLTGGGSPTAVEHEVRKFPYKTTEELVAWRDRLVSIKEAREQTPEQLRQVLKATAPSQYKPVPEIYQRRSMLISLANENVAEFKSLVRKCGQNQINAILQKKD